MTGMFGSMEAFDQDLGGWDISSLEEAFNMFNWSAMSIANFDATLAGWARLDPGEEAIPTGVTLGAHGLRYSDVAAFETLTQTYGWTIGGTTRVYPVTSLTTDDDSRDLSSETTAQRIAGMSGDDHVIGGTGADALMGEVGADTLEGGLGQDTLTGDRGDDWLFGARQTGDTEADQADWLFGGAGNDHLDGGAGNDELRGDAGNDTILGGRGADTVIGGAGDDILSGGAFGDLLFGGYGMDFINGGFGSDRANGGRGADTFYHLGVAEHGSDWIQDYNAAQGDYNAAQGDVLQFGGTATRDQFQVNTATTAGAGAGDVQEAFVIYRPTGQILWALVDGDGQDQINLRLGAQVFDLTA
ncbi:hypothetical protein K3551_18295 (plasmid) [Jannaschia sp. M317]|nr:hypothetical protein K3551_18295 [Jannaschia sp. M317]